MAHSTETIAGHEVNLTTSADGDHIRSLCIMVGDADKAGARSKDEGGRNIKHVAKREVLAALQGDERAAWLLKEIENPRRKRTLVRAASRFTVIYIDGSSAIRLDEVGNVTGRYRK